MAIVAAFNVSLNSQRDKSSDISLANVEAYANPIEDWWNRADYECRSVTCRPIILPNYKSTAAEYKGAGQGSVAHSWDCTGCGDNGYTVD